MTSEVLACFSDIEYLTRSRYLDIVQNWEGGGLKNHKLFIKNLVLTFFNGGGGGGGGGLSSCPNCSAMKL